MKLKAITLAIGLALLVPVNQANELERKMAAFEVATSLLCDRTLEPLQYQTCIGLIADEMNVDRNDILAYGREYFGIDPTRDIESI